MSDDDPGGWFEDSSNSDDGQGGTQPTERRLEAVPEALDGSDYHQWFDEPDATPEPPVASAAQGGAAPSTARAKVLFVGVVVAVLVIIAGGALFLSTVLGNDESSQAAPVTVPPTPTAEPDSTIAADAECQTSREGSVTTGRGSGDTDSVAGVVLAFQHAYYVERDATNVESLLSEDSKITDLEALQKGIDTVDKGTKHCLEISTDDETAQVELTEIAPDGTETVYMQRVTTTSEDGDVQIVSIEDAS